MPRPRPSWPRRLRRLCLFLLLGLVTTVGVAWGASRTVSYSEAPTVRLAARDLINLPFLQVHNDGGYCRKAFASTRLESTFDSAHSRALPRTGELPGWSAINASIGRAGQKNQVLGQDARGWPSRAAHYLLVFDGDAQSIEVTGGFSVHSSRAASAQLGFVDQGVIAYLPLWLGLIADTLFYALILATLHQLTTHTRRAHRHKRNRCPTCNYDLTGIDGPCPECGGER